MSTHIEQCPDCGSKCIILHRRQVAMVTPECGRTYKRIFMCEMCGFRFYGTGEECEREVHKGYSDYTPFM